MALAQAFSPDPVNREFMSLAKFVSVDGEHAIGTWSGVVMAAWVGATRGSAVKQLTETIGQLAAETGGPVALLQWVSEDAPMPFNKDIRDELANMLAQAKSSVAVSALVAPGTGFRMATGRAIVTGITMLAQPVFPHNIFQDLQSAVNWQVGQLRARGIPSPRPGDFVGRMHSVAEAPLNYKG